MQTRRRSASLLSVVLFAAAAHAQSPAQKPPPPQYPYDVVPVDAIYGHLSEGAFSEPAGLCFDVSAKELLVADSKNGLIGVYNSELTPVFAFGGTNLLVEPLALSVLPDGTICVLDALRTELKRFSYRGAPLDSLRFLHEAAPGIAAEPVRIHAFEHGADGRWFIATQEKDASRLLVYGSDLGFVRELEASKKAVSYRSIAGMALSREGRLAVIDQQAVPAVHVYEPDGTLSAAFGAHDVGLMDFTAPAAIAFDEDGFLYAVDLLKHDVKIFTAKGEFLSRFGGWSVGTAHGRGPGELLYPVAIACAPGGRIFVSERYGQRVQVFERRPRPELKPAQPVQAPAR